MDRRGRKPKLTPELTDKICRSIRDGNFPSVAARAHGIDDSTFFRWLKAGEDDAADFNGTPLTEKRHEEFRAFRRKILEAEAMAEVLLVGTVRSSAFEITQNADGTPRVIIKDWRAAALLLSTRFRKRWAADIEEDPLAPASARGSKRPVVFGARYAPDGQLRVPTLPPQRTLAPAPVQTAAPGGGADGGPQGASGESRAAGAAVPIVVSESRARVPDV